MKLNMGLNVKTDDTKSSKIECVVPSNPNNTPSPKVSFIELTKKEVEDFRCKAYKYAF